MKGGKVPKFKDMFPAMNLLYLWYLLIFEISTLISLGVNLKKYHLNTIIWLVSV